MSTTRRRRAWLCAPMLALCVGLAAPASRAQPAGGQELAGAQVLFDEAMALMARSDFAAACPKLEEVVRIVPGGLGARLRLAECYERAGKLATAWSAYRVAADAAAAAEQPERASFATEQAAALAPRLPKLAVRVPPALRELPGLEVRRDGVVLGRALWDAAVPVDPGVHTVHANAPGVAAPFDAAIELGEAKADTVTIVLERTTTPVAAPPSPGPVGLGPAARPPSAARPLWPWIVGGAGVALDAVAIGFFVDQQSVQREIDQHCGDASYCTRADGFDVEQANARLWRDFGLFVGLGVTGLAAIGTGIGGVLMAGKEDPAEAPAVALVPWIGGQVTGGSLWARFE